MKRSDIARTAGAALLVLSAAALTAQGATAAPKAAAKPPAKSASATAVLKVAPVVYRERRLANGLQVITVENHSSPTVSVQVWYHVGSRDDPPGRSGFAHLFEHMMFKSTANLRAEQFDRLTEDVGGANNASTGDDVTEYHEVVPSNHLETLLWAEAERMMNLKVDEENFKSERAVVEEEYRQRVLASPYGRLFNAISLGVVPRASVQAARASAASRTSRRRRSSDVVAFHARHYRPDNATLVVAGDFDQKQLDAWIDKYFGPVPQAARRRCRRFEAREPPGRAIASRSVTGPQVPLPAVALTWLAPPVTSPDSPALQVASAVLSSGESSRLNQSLVYRQRIATQAGFSADLRVGPGLLVAYAIAAGGKTPADVSAALLAEVARLASAPPSPAELAKVKTQLVTQAYMSRQTAFGLASAIARGRRARRRRCARQHRPRRSAARDRRRRPARHAQVRARRAQGDDRRIARKRSRRNEPARPPPRRARASLRRAIALAFAGALATAQPYTTPPPPAAPRPLAIAAPSETKLANGLRVIVARREGIPLVSAELVALAGAEADPPRLSGLASLSAALMTQGTRRRSAPELAAAAETLGGSLDSGAGWNQSLVSMTVTTPKLDAALALVAEVVREPVFAPDEIERVRTQTLDSLKVAYASPGTLAGLVAERLAYGAGAYGHPASGTPESLPRIARDDLVAAHRRAFRPDNAVLILAGDITPESRRWRWRGATSAAGPRRASRAPTPPVAAPARSGPAVAIVDMPKSGQAASSSRLPLPERSGSERAIGAVLNSVLGGGYSSRLNQEIRIKRGLSYGASSIARRAPRGRALSRRGADQERVGRRGRAAWCRPRSTGS